MGSCLFLCCMALGREGWGRRGRTRALGAVWRFCPLGKTGSWGNMCRPVMLQSKGNALQEHFHELAINQKGTGEALPTSLNPASRAMSLALQALPLLGACLVHGQSGCMTRDGAAVSSCVRASSGRPHWGLPPQSKAHLN